MVKNRHLSSEGILIELYNTYIKSISLFGGNKYKNMKDQLTIRASGYTSPFNYSFIYSPTDGYVNIEINYKIASFTLLMMTRMATDIPFRLTYLPLTFNILYG